MTLHNLICIYKEKQQLTLVKLIAIVAKPFSLQTETFHMHILHAATHPEQIFFVEIYSLIKKWLRVFVFVSGLMQLMIYFGREKVVL